MVAIIQIIITCILILGLPLWKKNNSETDKMQNSKAIGLKQVLKIKGAKEVMITFFCYCAIEQTAMLWASSYMVFHNNIGTQTAASFASLFFIGITIGRAINGFLTFRFNDTQMIRAGQIIIGLGVIAMLIPTSNIIITIIGLILVGLGCAPIYPSIIHSTPDNFGADKSQAIIGAQMASAYIGTCIMPPIFGIIANNISIYLFPMYLLMILILMILMHERLILKVKN